MVSNLAVSSLVVALVLMVGGVQSATCPAYEPFQCPDQTTCISIHYLCDGSQDCPDGFDEDSRVCTAAKRPAVDTIADNLHHLVANNGPHYLEKIFGNKGRDSLTLLGGVTKVAIAFAESKTIEDFGVAVDATQSELQNLRSLLTAVQNGNLLNMMESLGINKSEEVDLRYFLGKLLDTGFLV